MKRLVFVLLVLNGICLLFALLPALFLFTMVNPIKLAFITPFSVYNGIGEAVRVTPVGTFGSEGVRSPLPMLKWSLPYVYSSQSGSFRVESGETLVLYYDSDDVILSELVVEGPRGQLGELAAKPETTQGPYVVPEVADFSILDLGVLNSVRSEVLAAYSEAQEVKPLWPLLLWCSLPVVIFPFLLLIHLRLRRGMGSVARCAG